MQATRKDILDMLRRDGAATVKQIGSRLSLTPTGIRQHLTVLERDGLVISHEERGHVGRPSLSYSLTPEGHALYPKKYDDLANLLIDEARRVLGPQAAADLIKSVAARFAEPYAGRVEGKPVAERMEIVAQILEERGNIVSASPEGESPAICKHTCEYWNVAQQNSIICALDVEFVRQLVGADARLTSSLLRGDSACTFDVRSNGVKAVAR